MFFIQLICLIFMKLHHKNPIKIETIKFHLKLNNQNVMVKISLLKLMKNSYHELFIIIYVHVDCRIKQTILIQI